eukprot:364918-Chlamydomonas_euryale.AAC.17
MRDRVGRGRLAQTRAVRGAGGRQALRRKHGRFRGDGGGWGATPAAAGATAVAGATEASGMAMQVAAGAAPEGT